MCNSASLEYTGTWLRSSFIQCSSFRHHHHFVYEKVVSVSLSSGHISVYAFNFTLTLSIFCKFSFPPKYEWWNRIFKVNSSLYLLHFFPLVYHCLVSLCLSCHGFQQLIFWKLKSRPEFVQLQYCFVTLTYNTTSSPLIYIYILQVLPFVTSGAVSRSHLHYVSKCEH